MNDFKAKEISATTTLKLWLCEKREGYDLVMFTYFRTEFLKEKLNNKTMNEYISNEVMSFLFKEKEMGTYFHNVNGVAYGAAKLFSNGKMEVLHGEYWIHGRRIIDKNEIKILFDDRKNKEEI